jgi:hypothetical protein
MTGALVAVASLAAASFTAAGIGFIGAAITVMVVPETLRRKNAAGGERDSARRG